ncbi:MAG TPA: pseudouridine synthase [Solirubrobacteraceae bacterium]|nr:pseudouridine synthase [Solirubrobacteraceae bacterium]
MRLARYLAHAGVASRRAAEALVATGAVTVDGEVVTDPARDVGDGTDVRVHGEPVAPLPPVTFALHKPTGVVSTAADTHGRPTVVELVDAPGRLYPVGRLDLDTSGLILITNDGELANLLTHPRYGVAKTYRAKLGGGPLGERALRALRAGVALADGPTAPAKVERRAGDTIDITITEGRNRQVRRMCETVGHPVLTLRRIAFGPLELGALAPGEHRELTGAEVRALRAAAL